MSDRRSAADLGPSAEAVLGAFPVPERDWERDARAIEARLSASGRESTDAALLSAPLPSEAGEPSSASATTTPPATSGIRQQSLAELARRSVEKRQSDERERARKSLVLAAQERANEHDLPAPRAALLGPSPVPARPTSATSAGGAARAWPRLALGISALCIAAAALLWLRRPEPSPVAAGTPVSPSAPRPAAAFAPGEVASPGAGANAARAIAPPTLPSDPTASSAELAASELPTLAASGPSAAAATKSGPGVHVAERVVLADEHAKAATVPSHDGRLQKRLPPDPALRPADSSGGDLPTKPSTGAVQAALGSVMSGARHCVAGAQAPSSAVVVFGSDGRVQQVSVTGPAAGTSAGACIEAQLSRARVQPFAATNFSVSATVRPD